MRSVLRSAALLAFFLNLAVWTCSIVAQQNTGRINGLVTDTSGAILPGATVEVQSNGLRAVSDSQGQFSIPNVAPGTYTLKVSYVGFSTSETPVTVVAGQPANVTAVLPVASES